MNGNFSLFFLLKSILEKNLNFRDPLIFPNTTLKKSQNFTEKSCWTRPNFYLKILLYYRPYYLSIYDLINISKLKIMWKSKTRVTICELRVRIYELRVQIYELQVQSTSYEFKFTSYEFRSTSWKTKNTSCKIKTTSWEIKRKSKETKSTNWSNKTTSLVNIQVKRKKFEFKILNL